MCLTCLNGALRAKEQDRDGPVRRMARLGFVNCLKSPWRASFHGMFHVCEKYQQADEETSQARIAWFKTSFPDSARARVPDHSGAPSFSSRRTDP